MKRPYTISRLGLAAALIAAVLVHAGCLQIETRILLHPDGSATITERVRFSQALLDLGTSAGGNPTLVALLEKPAVLDRIKHMGQGTNLVSHQVRDSTGGSRESVAVFQIPDIRQFRYASPFLAFSDYKENCLLKADMFPVYESTWYGRRAGQMAVTFTATAPHKQERQPKEGEPPPPGPAPATQQVLRDLQPMFRDMLAGCHIRVTFESFAPLRFRQYYRYRDRAAGTRCFDLIDFADKDLDQLGGALLANEEVMLELLATDFSKANLLEAVKEHGTNATLTVYHPRGIPEIYFNPSMEMYKAYFEGKILKFDPRDGGERPANWDEIGHRGAGDRPKEPTAGSVAPTTGPDTPATTQPAGGRRPGRPRLPGRTTRTPTTSPAEPEPSAP